MFRIRQQRVMAIIALKQMEADAEASGRLKADEEDEFQVLMETEVYDCIESQGVGEQYIVTSASFPKQEVRVQQLALQSNCGMHQWDSVQS